MKIYLFILIAIAPLYSYSAERCEDLFSPQTQIVIYNPEKASEKYVTDMVDMETKIQGWQAELREAAKDGNLFTPSSKVYDINDKVTLYAIQLIKNHENNKFLYLARHEHISLPMNRRERRSIESAVHYGAYLLEHAILAGNDQIVRALLNAPEVLGVTEIARIYQWNYQLVEAVQKYPKLRKYITQIEVEKGGAFDKSLTESVSKLNPKRQEMIGQFLKDQTMTNLQSLLIELLPKNTVTVQRDNDESITLNIFAHKIPNGDIGAFYLHIRDSAYLNRKVFGGAYYTKETAFSTAAYEEIEGTAVMKIISAEFKDNKLTVLVNRGRESEKRDGRKNLFQEITLQYDSTDRLQSITLANGNNRIAKSLWTRQTFVLPDIYTAQRSNVYFHGYQNDMYQDVAR